MRLNIRKNDKKLQTGHYIKPSFGLKSGSSHTQNWWTSKIVMSILLSDWFKVLYLIDTI